MRPKRKKIEFTEDSMNEFLQELYNESLNNKSKISRLYTKWESKVKDEAEIISMGMPIMKLIDADSKILDQKIVLLKVLKDVVKDKNKVDDIKNIGDEEQKPLNAEDKSELRNMIRELKK